MTDELAHARFGDGDTVKASAVTTFASVGEPDGAKDYPEVHVVSFVSKQDRAVVVAFIADAVSAGKMTIPIDHRGELKNAGTAQAAFTKGGFGKVLLVPEVRLWKHGSVSTAGVPRGWTRSAVMNTLYLNWSRQ